MSSCSFTPRISCFFTREAAALESSSTLSCSHNFLTSGSRNVISLRRSIPFKNLRINRSRSGSRPEVFSKAKDITQDDFEAKVLKSELPVLVDFWADWCGPCKLVAPVVDWASENYAGKLEVYKIDSDKSPALVEKYKPYGLPTLILFKDGVEVEGSRREGAITKAKLKAHLDNLLSPAAV